MQPDCSRFQKTALSPEVLAVVNITSQMCRLSPYHTLAYIIFARFHNQHQSILGTTGGLVKKCSTLGKRMGKRDRSAKKSLADSDLAIRSSIRKEFEAAKTREAQLSLIRHLVSDVRYHLANNSVLNHVTTRPSATANSKLYNPGKLHLTTVRPAASAYYRPSHIGTFISRDSYSRNSATNHASSRPSSGTLPTSYFIRQYARNSVESHSKFAEEVLPGVQISATDRQLIKCHPKILRGSTSQLRRKTTKSTDSSVKKGTVRPIFWPLPEGNGPISTCTVFVTV